MDVLKKSITSPVWGSAGSTASLLLLLALTVSPGQGLHDPRSKGSLQADPACLPCAAPSKPRHRAGDAEVGPNQINPQEEGA